MERWITLFLTGAGIALIYAGYLLFCGLPSAENRRNVSKTRLLMLNVLPGALLALSGMAIITAQVRTVLVPHASIQHHQPLRSNHAGIVMRVG